MLLDVKNLNVGFLVKGKLMHIIHNVNFSLREGEVLSMIGETGCGKSVTGSTILHLLPDNAKVEGSITYRDKDITHMPRKQFHKLRGSEIVAVPQSPSTSLDPLMQVGIQVEEAVTKRADFKGGRKAREQVRSKVGELFRRMQLPGGEQVYSKYPCELSGGMCQRILIAMGAVTKPSLLVVDEPTKAIDWVLRADVVEVLRRQKQEIGCAILMITHDIGVARNLSDRIAVMYAGEIVEMGTTAQVLDETKHPYTEGLLNSLPDRGFQVMKGFMPSFEALPSGCRFSDRCPYATERCCREEPGWHTLEDGHLVHCHRWEGGSSHA